MEGGLPEKMIPAHAGKKDRLQGALAWEMGFGRGTRATLIGKITLVSPFIRHNRYYCRSFNSLHKSDRLALNCHQIDDS